MVGTVSRDRSLIAETWDWAGAWVGTRAFYAAETVGGISGVVVGRWTTGDALQGGASGLALGAALTAPHAFLARACMLVARCTIERLMKANRWQGVHQIQEGPYHHPESGRDTGYGPGSTATGILTPRENW